MATNKAVRADDVSGLSIATVQNTEDAISKDWQRIVLNDPSTPANMAAVSAGGAVKVDNSAVTQPVSVAATVSVRPSDGTNPITSTFDLDSGAGTQYSLGVAIAVPASGGAAIIPGDATNGLKVQVTSAPTTAVTGTFWQATQPVSFTPATSGGLSIYHVITAASTNAANIKASAGQVFGWNIFNNAAYPIYVKFHNTNGTPTAGASVVHTVGIQAGTGRDFNSDSGIAFGTGIGISIVKDITDAGTTAVAASDASVEVYYK